MASKHLTCLLLILLICPTGCTQTPPEKETVVIAGHTFTLEVADDEAERELGLMDRTAIPEHGGMLFIFPDTQPRGFWMGHCAVDIDIIFLDANGRITSMHRMKAEPPQREDESDSAYRARMPTYVSRLPARFAVELQAGWLDRLSLRVDQKVGLELSRLKARAR